MAKHDISPEMTNPARIVTLANTPNYIFHYLRRESDGAGAEFALVHRTSRVVEITSFG